MKPLTIEVTKSYVACANCGEGISSHAHITTPQSTKWTCDACSSENYIVFGEGGAVTSVSLTGNGSIMGAGLMVSTNTQDDPIFLFIDVPFYAHNMKDGKLIIDDEFASGQEYYYDSHTCPTNWIQGQVRKIVHRGDDDPHGVFVLIGLWDKATLLKYIEDGDVDHAAISKYTLERYHEINKVVLTFPPVTLMTAHGAKQLDVRSSTELALINQWAPADEIIIGTNMSNPAYRVDPTACYPVTFSISNPTADVDMMSKRMEAARNIRSTVTQVVRDFFMVEPEPSDKITNLQTVVDSSIKTVMSLSPDLWVGYHIGVKIVASPSGLSYVCTPELTALLVDDITEIE